MLVKRKIKKSFRKYKGKVKFQNFLKFNTRLKKSFLTKMLTSHSSHSQMYDYQISVRITSNNVFCTAYDYFSKKIELQFSAGKCDLRCSKKLLKHVSRVVLNKFFDNFPFEWSRKKVLVKFSGPVRSRRFILNQLFFKMKKLKTTLLTFHIVNNTAFNGCRPPKAKRKKNKNFRIFK